MIEVETDTGSTILFKREDVLVMQITKNLLVSIKFKNDDELKFYTKTKNHLIGQITNA